MSLKEASAGRRGDRVRSDIWISIELSDKGGINLDLKSKVEVLYGKNIREMILEGLEFFSIKNANVQVEDQGALPFVIKARLEAAVRRLFPGKNLPAWLPDQGPEFVGSKQNRFRRSRLYLPGNEPKFVINAAVHGADGLIIDLEDSVAPSEKDAARLVARNSLYHLDFLKSEKIVRINQGERGLEDLEYLVPYGIQLVLVPKVESAEEFQKVDAKIQELRKKHNIDYNVWMIPILESAKGCWFAYEIASATPNCVALSIGLEDYTADIGAQRTLEGTESFWARAQVINGAKAAGIQALDTVFSDVADSDGLRSSVKEAKSLGFEGKGCIHPRQVKIVHEEFAPTDSEIKKAKKIVLAFEEADRQGLGVVSLGSKMIDPPVVKRALHTINQAEADGLLQTNWREEA